MNIRNIAIIAHVDHGKTTLVDALLKQGGAFSAHQEVGTLIMDSDDQERERGITIYAKNAAIRYGDCRINIVDTPGHADFGSEVERVLRQIDGVVLLVDAQEGPMPQTKFVLKKSLELGLHPIVVINKIDRHAARPQQVVDEVFDLFVLLGASDTQLNFPYLFAMARDGIVHRTLDDASTDMTPLFQTILSRVPPPLQETDAPFLMQPCALAYDSYIGRLGVGRVYAGSAKVGDRVFLKRPDGTSRTAKITKLMHAEGIERREVPQVSAGDIITIAGVPDIMVGDTIAGDEHAEPLPAITIDSPTISMVFLVNDSPFAGREGSIVTLRLKRGPLGPRQEKGTLSERSESNGHLPLRVKPACPAGRRGGLPPRILTTRHIRERLHRECETNVGLKVENVPGSDAYKVYGRGELHLSVLVEQMRREGFELQLSRPEVITREGPAGREEPIEHVVIDVPEESVGTVIAMLALRKGVMQDMCTRHSTALGEGGTVVTVEHTRLEYLVPTRGLLGMRGDFIIETRGEGILTHSFLRYEPWKGDIPDRTRGSLISMVAGKATAYDLWKLENRGRLFITPGTEMYEGMIIGESAKEQDIVVNAIRGKKLTNIRAAGSDEAIQLTPITPMTLEQAMEYIADDEVIEVTPFSIRLRKKLLTEHERKRAARR